MNRIEMHRALDRLIDRVQDVESAMRLLVADYNKQFPYERLTLFLQRDPKAGHEYGPYWGKLRKINKGGKRITVKRHLGTRLTRKQMYHVGLVNHRAALREYDRRARKLRKAHNRWTGKLRRIRRILQGVGE